MRDSTLAQRLKHARKERGLTQQQLSEASGVNQSDISKIERGETLRPTGLLSLAMAMKCNPYWLETGDGKWDETLAQPPGSLAAPTNVGWSKTSSLMEVRSRLQITDAQSNVEDAPVLKENRLVPVVGEVKGGDDGFLEELQYPVGHGEGCVDYPTSDTAAYALRVRGDSMHPRYRAGEFIVVTPSIAAQPSDDVVVALKDGRKLLKVLNWIQDGEIQLLSVNNHFGPLTLQLSEVEFVHLVDGRVRRSAFHRA
jgi:phage repressor protein C with HTH and peptisase S24 domain